MSWEEASALSLSWIRWEVAEAAKGLLASAEWEREVVRDLIVARVSTTGRVDAGEEGGAAAQLGLLAEGEVQQRARYMRSRSTSPLLAFVFEVRRTVPKRQQSE